jgi:hypothetical protein
MNMIKALDYQSLPNKYLSLKEMYPAYYNILSATQKKAHDEGFATLTNRLAKVDPTVYEPIIFTTYRKDFAAIEASNELVDNIEYYATDYKGLVDDINNIVATRNDVVPKVSAGLNQAKVPVFLFQLTYVLKFAELEKLNKKSLPISIEQVYQKAAAAGFELFVDRVSHLGMGIHGGLFNSADVEITTGIASQAGIAALTDAQIIALVNTPIKNFLSETNYNIEMMPDTFRVPTWFVAELQNRNSTLYTQSLYDYVLEHNLGTAAAKAHGITGYKFTLEGRPQLDAIGTVNKGRVVVYKNDGRFVKLHIPYAFQAYMTQPDMTELGYVTLFLAQVSAPQIPYAQAIHYYDFTA